jgi:hypothetical protein
MIIRTTVVVAVAVAAVVAFAGIRRSRTADELVD